MLYYLLLFQRWPMAGLTDDTHILESHNTYMYPTTRPNSMHN